MQFDHVGIVTTEKKAGEIFIEPTRVWITQFQEHPYRVEWLRYEPDSPVTGPVREMPHVAYRVDDIEAASKGMKVLLQPFDVGFAVVAFYQSDDGAVIEFMKYKEG
jgi:catechol 2,3-dioxygenase-like lactoylglutathione lyase family enzyme